MNANTKNLDSMVFGQLSWSYYNTIKKKATESEFSWSGLIVSLSVAFFIVVTATLVLSLVYQSVETGRISLI